MISALIRSVFVTVCLCTVILIGYWQLVKDHSRKVIRELEQLNTQLETKLAARNEMIDRLSRSRRLAHIHITSQITDENGEITETQLLFIELDDSGRELGRQSFTIPGDVIFVDAWTVKFDHEKVAQGHPLMGRTLVLLRRIYSENMLPSEGIAIDTPGAIPPGYAADQAGEFEKQVWEHFWEVATNSESAQQMGVRVAQGEAVYKPVREGQTYELTADAASGISLMPLSRGDNVRTQIAEQPLDSYDRE